MAASEEGPPEDAILAEQMRATLDNIINVGLKDGCNRFFSRMLYTDGGVLEQLRNRFNEPENIADKIKILAAFKEFAKHLTYCKLHNPIISVRRHPRVVGDDDDTWFEGGEVTIVMYGRYSIRDYLHEDAWREEALLLTSNLEMAMHGNSYFSLLILTNEGVPDSTLFVNLTG
jgi:hypothetical protein